MRRARMGKVSYLAAATKRRICHFFCRTTSLARLELGFTFPILWMSGHYTLDNAKAFGVIPLKSRRGDFNVDLQVRKGKKGLVGLMEK